MNTTGPANESHQRHMDNLKGMRTTQERREYIDAVERNEGKFAGKWLREDFVLWWTSRTRGDPL